MREQNNNDISRKQRNLWNNTQTNIFKKNHVLKILCKNSIVYIITIKLKKFKFDKSTT